MTTWQAVISTATPAQSTGQLGATELAHAGAAKNTPAFPSILQPMAKHVASAWRWLEHRRTQQLASRRLRVAETVQLGEKRFVSIVQVDGAHFLIGGAAGSVSLLAVLNTDQSAAEVVAYAEGKQ